MASSSLTDPPPFARNFYYDHPEITKLSQADVDAWRHENRIEVSDRQRTP